MITDAGVIMIKVARMRQTGTYCLKWHIIECHTNTDSILQVFSRTPVRRLIGCRCGGTQNPKIEASCGKVTILIPPTASLGGWKDDERRTLGKCGIVPLSSLAGHRQCYYRNIPCTSKAVLVFPCHIRI